MAKEEMTKEKAVAILQSKDMHRFDEAKEFLQKNYPEIWKEYEKFIRQEAEEKAASQESILKTIEMVARNKEELRVLANDYDIGQIGIREVINPIMDRVDMYQKDEKTGEEVLLSKKEKTDYFKVLYSSARLEVEQALVQSESFHNATKKEKKEKVREAIEDNMLVKIYRVAAASSMEMPSGKEVDPGSPHFFKYNKRQADKFRKMAQDVFASDKKIKINADAVLLSVADTAAKTEAFSEKLHETAKSFDGVARQKLNDVADHFKKRKSHLELLANKVSNGKYQERIKPVVKAIVKGGKDSIKDNIFKIGTNIVVGGGIAAAIGAGAAATPLVMAYGVYHGVSSWGWPIVAEARKVRRLAKEEGKHVGFWESYRQGAKIATATKKVVKTDKNGKEVVKKKNPYVVRGVINSVLGIAGGIALSKALQAKDAVTNAADVVNSAVDATNAARGQAMSFRLFKTLTPSGAQLVDAGVSFVTDPHDPTTRKRAGWEAVGALATATIGAATLGLSEYNATHEGGVKGLWDHIFHKEPVEDIVDPVVPEPEPVLPEPVEFERFPTEWNENLGISERRFNIMMSRLNNGKIADFDAQSLDRAYMNMDDEFMSHFEGKTKMQVFYDYVELARNGQRHQYVLGNAEHGFFINTPTGRHAITDEGVIEQAKKALANGEKLLISRLHGRSFLQEQFENVKIDGMTEEKMNQVIEIAMHTYDPNQVSGATAEIHKLFPDLTGAQLKVVREIVDYNRAYEQNGELMDQIGRALGCGEKDGIDYAAAAALLDKRHAILSLSNGPSRPISQNGPDCPTSTMLAVRGAPAPEPKVPEFETEVEVADEPLVIPPTKALDTSVPAVRKMAVVAKVEEPAGREYLAKNVSDHWNNAKRQKTLSDEEAERLIRIQEKLAGKSK